MLRRIGAVTVASWATLTAYSVYVALRPNLNADTCAHPAHRDAGMPWT